MPKKKIINGQKETLDFQANHGQVVEFWVSNQNWGKTVPLKNLVLTAALLSRKKAGSRRTPGGGRSPGSDLFSGPEIEEFRVPYRRKSMNLSACAAHAGPPPFLAIVRLLWGLEFLIGTWFSPNFVLGPKTQLLGTWKKAFPRSPGSSRAEPLYTSGSASGQVHILFPCHGTRFYPSGSDFPPNLIGTRNSPISGSENKPLPPVDPNGRVMLKTSK
jgi:hypothetical protein